MQDVSTEYGSIVSEVQTNIVIGRINYILFILTTNDNNTCKQTTRICFDIHLTSFFLTS